MKISRTTRLVVGAMALLVVAGASPAIAADAVAPRTAPGQLTEQSLGTLLQAMGLEIKKEQKRYDFSFDAVHEGEEWRLTMSAVLSENGKSIWIMAWLDELPRSAADVPRTALLRLLADNDRLGNGKFFAYIASNRRFVLQRVIPNEGVTTAEFRDALQDLGGSVADTYAHWAVANWKTGTTADASASNPNTAGQDADKTAPTTPVGPTVRPRPLTERSALEDSKFRGVIRN